MSNEIELKFQINNCDIADLQSFLNQWASSDELEFSSLSNNQRTFSTLSLYNCYYDTADNYLRNHHCGLRLRATENNESKQYEMTLKRDSHSIAGLHERAEYNVDLSCPQLDLSVFPVGVFPNDCDIEKLQKNLQPLFTTNFTRQVWLISFANSEIEVALDLGKITSNGKFKPIQEVELEIKQGNKQDLINFAIELSRFNLHLFSQSKASRGYRLLLNKPVTSEIFSAQIEQDLPNLLNFWQQNEEYALENNDFSYYKQLLIQINEVLINLNLQIEPDFEQWQMAIQRIDSIAKFAYSEVNTKLKLKLISEINGI